MIFIIENLIKDDIKQLILFFSIHSFWFLNNPVSGDKNNRLKKNIDEVASPNVAKSSELRLFNTIHSVTKSKTLDPIDSIAE
ncbi:hypothetical protein CEG15_12455 [Vibrio anguillarum]|nr:hypothetical protein CEG15_12455 [Vibrio anguillarum]